MTYKDPNEAILNGVSPRTIAETIVASNEYELPDPEPLIIDATPKPYPVEALPPIILDAVTEVQSYNKAPMAIVAGSALAALSLAVQGHYDIKRDAGLEGPTSLYFLTVAESGERKSSTDKLFMAGIKEYERIAQQDAEPLISDYKANLKSWNAKVRGLETAIARLSADPENKAEVKTLEGQLNQLQAIEPKPPRVPSLICADTNPEALKKTLHEVWPSAGLITPEAGVIFGSIGMGSDNVMRFLGNLNLLWDGDEIPQQRVGTSNFTLRGARFTVGLQVQEEVLRDYVKRSKGLPKQIGFFGRCLIAWPESTQGDRLYRSAPTSWPKLAVYNMRIRELLAKPLQRNEQNQLTPLVLEMTPEAHHSWIDFYNKTEKEQAVGGKYEEITDIASKAADNVSRLACLFHVVSGGTGSIGADSINRAGRIIEWYLNESIRFYKAIGASAQHADAACLEKWLIDYSRKNNLETVSKSDVLKLGPNRFRKKDKLEMPLQELSEHNRVFERPEGNKTVLVIHPKLLK